MENTQSIENAEMEARAKEYAEMKAEQARQIAEQEYNKRMQIYTFSLEVVKGMSSSVDELLENADRVFTHISEK